VWYETDLVVQIPSKWMYTVQLEVTGRQKGIPKIAVTEKGVMAKHETLDVTGRTGYCPFRTKKIADCDGTYEKNGEKRNCGYGKDGKCSLGSGDGGNK
jgi:hypothetical protein